MLKPQQLALLAAVLSLTFRCDAGTPAPNPDAMATVVVFNQNDPVSTNLAGYYAEKRGIPFDHLIGLSCPPEETISRVDYDRSISAPLRKTLVDRGWWRLAPATKPGENRQVKSSDIRFVALIRGIPLRIAPMDTPYPGDNPEKLHQSEFRRNEAAVDSELATLAVGAGNRQITGPCDNPFFGSYSRLADAAIPGALLVCRLDAATAATVRRMIDDSIATEKGGLWGAAYIDSRHLLTGGWVLGDEWLRTVRNNTMRQGIPCVFDDSPDLFPEHYPMRQVALYFGWYSEQVAGAFKDEQFRFVPGAIAVHIHSFSAATLRLPLSNWCAPLLERGAAATLGNVYEPYLAFTPDLGTFEERLHYGWTFAEAAYASERTLSWMTTFIGDPLYRPFKAQQEAGFKPPAAASEWAAYLAAAQLWFSKDRATGERALQTQGNELKSGVILEGLGCLQAWAGDQQAAKRSWSQASRFYSSGQDQVRCALYDINALRNAGKDEEALGLVRKQLKAHSKTDAAALLRAIEAEMTRPPEPPPTTGTNGAVQTTGTNSPRPTKSGSPKKQPKDTP